LAVHFVRDFALGQLLDEDVEIDRCLDFLEFVFFTGLPFTGLSFNNIRNLSVLLDIHPAVFTVIESLATETETLHFFLIRNAILGEGRHFRVLATRAGFGLFSLDQKRGEVQNFAVRFAIRVVH
jgi:hypothetical protein